MNRRNLIAGLVGAATIIFAIGLHSAGVIEKNLLFLAVAIVVMSLTLLCIFQKQLDIKQETEENGPNREEKG